MTKQEPSFRKMALVNEDNLRIDAVNQLHPGSTDNNQENEQYDDQRKSSAITITHNEIPPFLLNE